MNLNKEGKNTMMYVTRKEHFSAAHRLHNQNWSEEKNRDVYGKCNNPNGHGHNYTIEVTVAGTSPEESGMVVDLKQLSNIMNEQIMERVDHKHLNHDVDFLQGVIPTAENLAMVFWKLLAKRFPQWRFYSVKLYESDNNVAEYRGDYSQSE
jgi:6-pyruvoyltetrahydropterin/6-carboxytetrahydropterin synthase